MTFREKLDRMGVTRYSLAKRTGIASTALYKLLAGKTGSPTVATVYRIHVATKGQVSFMDFIDPADERAVLELIEAFGPLQHAPGPGRPIGTGTRDDDV